MFKIKVNKLLLPLKICYFFMCACIGPIIGFMPTIARQLGYSLTTFGATMTFMSIISLVLTPVTGIVIDKFNVKKILFVLAILGMGVVSFFFLFVPKVPADMAVELKCDSKTIFTVPTDKGLQALSNETIFVGHNKDELITCKLNCNDKTLYSEQMNELRGLSYSSDDLLPVINDTTNVPNQIDVVIKLIDTEEIENSYVFHVVSAKVNGTQLPSTTCQYQLTTFCQIDCSNDVVKKLTTVTTYRGNVLNLYQFWVFFVLLSVFWASATTSYIITNTICLEILEDKSENYGKQRCWASIGWGLFSILIGWLVDIVSINKKEKDYSPVFYSCITLTILNLVVIQKIKVTESKKSKGKLKSVCGLFSKHYVITFYFWSASVTFFHTIITHFLFWYMEDLVSTNNDRSQRAWLKTLQGLAQGVQCFGGEIPFFFWSGWIIRKTGHTNCMALVLGVMAVRLYLYTVIWNPAWIILIELLNGLSFALGTAVKMSYAKLMSPPDTINTVIGFLGFFDCIGESLGSVLGGYLFDSYGGVWSFRFFAYASAAICCLNILTNFLGLTKNLKNLNTDVESKKTELTESSVNNKSVTTIS